jgi:hypothetical protein
MNDPINVNVLVSAKEEYTNHLCFVLGPLMYNGIMKIYRNSQNMPKKVSGFSYRNFQICLANVQNWSKNMITDETNTIKEQCPYLQDLVTAIFISHVKILACVRIKGNHKNIKLKIPSMDTFTHHIYCLICQKFYNSVQIIDLPKEQIVELIETIIHESIKHQLPIENILNEYLRDAFNDEASESDDNSEKSLKGEDIVNDDFDDDYDKESMDSEYKNEQKKIPVIPIEQNFSVEQEVQQDEKQKEEQKEEHMHGFEDTTKINITETPHMQPTSDTPYVPELSFFDDEN